MLNNIKIGEVIRYFRMKNNMSQRELANIVGIDRTEIILERQLMIAY